ncbi:MAG TPA: NAD(P)-dependent oxidoreductase [Woeseiaceae bacterium]|nr:NAD(P)-dependent oxidoreductase [Woeseiaceae bacterium]
MRVSFVGLGVMGYPMAGHLARSGYEVTVYNRTRAKAEAWCAEYRGHRAATPAAAAANAEITFCCVGNDADVRAVILGKDGILQGAASGAVIVDHTTASAMVAREVAFAAQGKGVGFLDAPVSGGQAGAELGQLTVMAGGDGELFERVLPVMRSYAKACTRIGEVGTGQLTKAVNQICIAGIVQGLSEGLHFAQRAGLDIEAVIGAISKGAAQSWQMENRWRTMVNDEFEFGFAVEWMRKDLKIALEEAERNGAALELTALVDRFYAELEQMGGSRWDTSSLIRRLERK